MTEREILLCILSELREIREQLKLNKRPSLVDEKGSIIQLYNSGMTYEQIAKRYRTSRQRIHQIANGK